MFRSNKQISSILLICLGNYCRSPLAKGLLNHAIQQTTLRDNITIDSAGLGDWHVGDGPDERTFLVAENYGIDLADHRARKITFEDFHKFDLILGMDHENMEDLNRIKPETTTSQLHLFLGYTLGIDEAIVDPYMYGEEAFETAFRQLQLGTTALIERLLKNQILSSLDAPAT